MLIFFFFFFWPSLFYAGCRNERQETSLWFVFCAWPFCRGSRCTGTLCAVQGAVSQSLGSSRPPPGSLGLLFWPSCWSFWSMWHLTEVLGLLRRRVTRLGALPVWEPCERILYSTATGRSPLALPSFSLSIEWLAQSLAACLLSQRGFLSGLFSAGRYY